MASAPSQERDPPFGAKKMACPLIHDSGKVSPNTRWETWKKEARQVVANLARPRFSLPIKDFGEVYPEAKIRNRARPAVPEGRNGGQSNFSFQLYQTRASVVKKRSRKKGDDMAPFIRTTLHGRRNLTSNISASCRDSARASSARDEARLSEIRNRIPKTSTEEPPLFGCIVLICVNIGQSMSMTAIEAHRVGVTMRDIAKV